MSSLTAASASSAAVATAVQFVTVTMVALTTTFTPPATCAEMHLTQLSWSAFEIWANEPQPVPGTKFGACYPSQFIDGYTSLGNASSSVAPIFSPLVCPSGCPLGWHTARTWENGYIACCAAYVCPPKLLFFASGRQGGLPQRCMRAGVRGGDRGIKNRA